MLCVGVQDSDTVEGELGALILRDEEGYEQSFGGLPDWMRRANADELIGKEYSVKFEQYTNGKYIQGFLDNN
jgi:hypothetical protein